MATKEFDRFKKGVIKITDEDIEFHRKEAPEMEGLIEREEALNSMKRAIN